MALNANYCSCALFAPAARNLVLGNICWPCQLNYMQDCSAYVLNVPISCAQTMCDVLCTYAVHVHLDSQQAAAKAMH